MSFLGALLDLLPMPYTQRSGSVVSGLLDAVALDMEAYVEDTDRMRRTHWVETAYRLGDLAKIGALVGVPALAWEDLEAYRARLVATVTARLAGSVGPVEIQQFVVDYLQRAQAAFGAVFVPNMAVTLVENPVVRRTSEGLNAVGNRVQYLFHWNDTNGGLDESRAKFRITGFPHGRTAVPILVNASNGDAIMYRDRIGNGKVLEIINAGNAAHPFAARALLDGRDVSSKLMSFNGISLGTPYDPARVDAVPSLPRMNRGANQWMYLSAGFYNVRGIDDVFFWIADALLRQGAFDRTRFDHAIFVTEPACRLEMWWGETQPATFEVQVPRTYVIVPTGMEAAYDDVCAALEMSIDGLRAAGVRGSVRFMPFTEVQAQTVRANLPFVRLDPDQGSAGIEDRVELSALFGSPVIDEARFS